MRLVRDDVRPSQLLTRDALENGVAAVAATGGSTNGVLHLLAIARELGIPLTIDEFDAIAARTPVVADIKPGGRFVATDLHAAGGVALVARELLKAGLVHGDAPTVDGRTLAEVAAAVVETPGQEVVVPIEAPLKATGGLAILRGNLAPEGCVVKLAGHERLFHRGPARVFDSEEECFAAVKAQGDRGRATSSSSATRAPPAGPGCARCCTSPRRSSARGSATRWRCHRRPLLRRDARADGRPRRAGGRARRPDRGAARRRRRRARRRGARAARLALRARSSRLGSPRSFTRRRATRPACSRATRRSSRPPRREPSSMSGLRLLFV